VASGSGIPDVPISAFVVDPNNSNHLYAGTDIGVYRSTDGGTSWLPFGAGLPRSAVFDMAIQNSARILRVATHGKGIWEIGLDNNTADIDMFSKTVAVSGPLEPGVTLTYTLRMTNTGGTAGIAIVEDTFPGGLEPAHCTGTGGAAYFDKTGDLDDTLTVLGSNGTAAYECVAQVENPVLDVDTIPSAANTPPGSTITYTIQVENLSDGPLQNVTVSDPFIPLANCSVNPSIPFNMPPNSIFFFSCPGVVVNNPVTHLTTADGTLPLTNTATVSGTFIIMQDTTVTVITAEASDQTTVTTGFTIFMPSVHKAAAPFAAVPALSSLAGIVPLIGVVLCLRRREIEIEEGFK
jgi:uncharacterized repeat protein (TIGR01451 family)